jgi:ABC-type uncharacterized transport system ATPase component
MSYPGEESNTIIITQVDGSVFKGNFIVVEDNGAGSLTYTYSVTMTLQ